MIKKEMNKSRLIFGYFDFFVCRNDNRNNRCGNKVFTSHRDKLNEAHKKTKKKTNFQKKGLKFSFLVNVQQR